MIYDKNIAALERKEREAEAEFVKQQEKLLETKRKMREAKSRLLATTRSDKWHAMTLTAEARRIGFTGEHAEALFYLHSLPLNEYVDAVKPYADDGANGSILGAEFAAVKANLTKWTELGKQKHWDRARREYEETVAGFRKWQADNPEKTEWRDKPATTGQYFLLWRTAEQIGIEQPGNLKCGEAHDWLVKHDANLRFRSPTPNGAAPQPETAALPAAAPNSSIGEGSEAQRNPEGPEVSHG